MHRKVIFFFIFAFLATAIFSGTAAADKIYIDITSPGLRPLPIAIQTFVGAKEVSEIVKADMTFTGLFDCLDEAAQIERPDQPFNSQSWKGLGVDLVVKGSAARTASQSLDITISAYDVSEGREVLRKQYTAKPDMSRPLAHTIANDIYKILTGKQGIFKTKIAFVGESSSSKQMYMMDWDGQRMYPIGIKAGILLTPRWSPDGTKLLYSAEKRRKWGIYVLDMNLMKELHALPLSGLGIAGNFFPDNRRFTYSAAISGNSDVFVGDIGGTPPRKTIVSPWIDVSPSVSPDGSSIIFVSNRSGNPQIYMSDNQGYVVRRITFTGSYNTSPSWAPSGDRIVYASMIGGKNQIFVIKLDGSEPTQLTTVGNNEDPSFSPDGRYIVFTSTRDGAKGVYVMRANGEGVKRITPKGFRSSSPGWSPF